MSAKRENNSTEGPQYSLFQRGPRTKHFDVTLIVQRDGTRYVKTHIHFLGPNSKYLLFSNKKNAFDHLNKKKMNDQRIR